MFAACNEGWDVVLFFATKINSSMNLKFAVINMGLNLEKKISLHSITNKKTMKHIDSIPCSVGLRTPHGSTHILYCIFVKHRF